MIPTIIEGVFRIRDAVEAIPIPAMMLVVPLGMLVVAGGAVVIARQIERWTPPGKH